jgi:hypothetical protein
MAETHTFNWIQLATALGAADEMCRPVTDEAASWIGVTLQLTLWRAGVDIPAELRKFVENGSIERGRLLGPLATALTVRPGGAALGQHLAELERNQVGVDRLLDALSGYMKYRGDRGPVAGWVPPTLPQGNS